MWVEVGEGAVQGVCMRQCISARTQLVGKVNAFRASSTTRGSMALMHGMHQPSVADDQSRLLHQGACTLPSHICSLWVEYYNAGMG
jgi:hypothetical protein